MEKKNPFKVKKHGSDKNVINTQQPSIHDNGFSPSSDLRGGLICVFVREGELKAYIVILVVRERKFNNFVGYKSFLFGKFFNDTIYVIN